MNNMGQCKRWNWSIEEIPERMRRSLVEMLEAIEYAENTSGDCWEFAVEIERLTAYGLRPNDFRWLVRRGFVEHRREVTLESDDGRTFCCTGDLTFPARTCFVLTGQGISFARLHCEEATSDTTLHSSRFELDDRNGARMEVNRNGLTNGACRIAKPPQPKWDPERRVLSVVGVTVKYFKWAAENQEAVLAVFEEEDWPPRIDDPLPPHPDQDAKRRLSDTIKCLNRKQSNPILRFRGDGTGEGVVWELVAPYNCTSGVAS